MKTSTGVISRQEGVLVKGKHEGCDHFCYGDIAIMPELGTENLNQAQAFLSSNISKLFRGEDLIGLPESLSSTSFALWGMFESEKNFYTRKHVLNFSGLLPGGVSGLSDLNRLREKGYRHFKWKIGLNFEEELEALRGFSQHLKPYETLRLDANGSLSFQEMLSCLEFIESCPNIDFLEQPLPVGQEKDLLSLSFAQQSRLALDESLRSSGVLSSLVREDWQGFYVIKPALMGHPDKWASSLSSDAKVIMSSLFETSIGLDTIIHLRSERFLSAFSVGFGTQDFLVTDGLTVGNYTGEQKGYGINLEVHDKVWNSVRKN